MFSEDDTRLIKGLLYLCIFGVFAGGAAIGWMLHP